MKRENERKHKKTSMIKQGTLLAALIGVSILSYKVYKGYSIKTVQANTVIEDNKGAKSKGQDIINTKNVGSKGGKYTFDIDKLKKILNKEEKGDGKKTVFLTFDDGPSTTVTPKILDVLKKYNVKGTFFLVGQNIDSNEQSKDLVKRIYNEGHALANHTYSHNIKTLYPKNKLDLECFMEEVEKTCASIKSVIGQDFTTRVLRMPGGYMSRKYYKDPNLEKFNERLKESGLYSIDWNAYDYDSEGAKKNSSQLLEEVKESVGSKEKVVLLMHDTYGKEETAKALPKIIEYLIDKGYEFRTIS